MKIIILTILLSSFLPAIAVAKDKTMHNSNPNASIMSGKHMMNANPNTPLMSGKHMMNANPYSSSSRNNARVANNEQVKKGYRVVKYKK